MKFTSALKLKLIYVFHSYDALHKGHLIIRGTTSNNENIWGLVPNNKALNEAAKYRINKNLSHQSTVEKLCKRLIYIHLNKDININRA